MDKFRLKFDQKCTTWISNTVLVEADSEEEAIDKLAKSALTTEWIGVDKDITYEDAVELGDTEEPLPLSENGGMPTVEIYSPSTGEIIWNNVDKYSI